MAYDLVPLAVFLPFLGFLINGLLGRIIKREALIGVIGSAMVGAGFLIGVEHQVVEIVDDHGALP